MWRTRPGFPSTIGSLRALLQIQPSFQQRSTVAAFEGEERRVPHFPSRRIEIRVRVKIVASAGSPTTGKTSLRPDNPRKDWQHGGSGGEAGSRMATSTLTTTTTTTCTQGPEGHACPRPLMPANLMPRAHEPCPSGNLELRSAGICCFSAQHRGRSITGTHPSPTRQRLVPTPALWTPPPISYAWLTLGGKWCAVLSAPMETPGNATRPPTNDEDTSAHSVSRYG